ncbi:MAG: GNAT family N-acetyltransferase [Phycisphaerae bacterium]
MSQKIRQPDGITLSEANARIAVLSRQPLAPSTDREDLDKPVDGDIKVETEFPRHSVQLMLDGQKVSWCGVYEFQQQIGPCTIRMGGIAGVGTHNDHRFKGYSRRVMDNSARWMRREGFDVAMLWGISGFYPKFGYAKAFPEPTHTIALRDAERLVAAAAGRRLRQVDFADEHLGAVLRMYRQTNAGRIGPALRDRKYWAPFRRGKHWGLKVQAKVLLDKAGRPVAYYAYDMAEDATIVEVGYATPVVFADLIRAAAEIALASRTERITFRLPEDEPLMRFCIPCGLRREVAYRADGGCMVRMINVTTTLRKIGPLLASRVGGAGRLVIQTNLEGVAFSWSRGEMKVEPLARGRSSSGKMAGPGVAMPQWALAQLVYGYRDVATMVTAGDVEGTRPSLEILAAMFPLTPHYFHPIDRF